MKTLWFTECDHEGDLEVYEWEVVNSGGHVTDKHWDPKRKMGAIEIIVDHEREYERFLERFRTKDSFHFLKNKGP